MKKNLADYVSSTEAAHIVGFSCDYIRKLLNDGTLKGEKVGRNWVIKRIQLKKIKRQRFSKP